MSSCLARFDDTTREGRVRDSYTDEAQLLERLRRAMREAEGFDEGAVAAV